MNNLLGIDLNSYNNVQGEQFAFDTANVSQQSLADLSKALTAGNQAGGATVNSTSASGAPLKPESLDRVLKVVTYREEQIVTYKAIPKDKAYSTVEEYTQLSDYGSDRGGFINEAELPQNEDSTYIRRSQLVKFLGVVKSVSDVMTLVNNIAGNIIDREAQNGTLWILKQLNRALWKGDDKLIPQEFNGMFAQHAKPDNTNYVGGSQVNYLNDEIVFDLRGKVMTEQDIELGAEVIVENFGNPSQLFGPPKMFSNYVNQTFDKKRIFAGTSGQSTMMGQSVPGQLTDYGTINFMRDIFMRRQAPVTVGQPSAASSNAKAPTSPVPDATTPVALVGSDTDSKWTSGEAGNYFYGVRAINRFGKSAFVVLDSTAVAIAAAQNAVDLKFAAGSGGEAATAFEIYRTKVGQPATKFYHIFDVSVSELAAGFNGGAANTVRDLNLFLPDTDQAMLLDSSPEVWKFKQLAPLMKLDLAIISPAYRFMLLMYGTLLNHAPRKQVRFINVGNLSA